MDGHNLPQPSTFRLLQIITHVVVNCFVTGNNFVRVLNRVSARFRPPPARRGAARRGEDVVSHPWATASLRLRFPRPPAMPTLPPPSLPRASALCNFRLVSSVLAAANRVKVYLRFSHGERGKEGGENKANEIYRFPSRRQSETTI